MNGSTVAEVFLEQKNHKKGGTGCPSRMGSFFEKLEIMG